MADQSNQQQTETKRTYKPRTPDVNRVIEAVIAGDYDEDLKVLKEAVNNRNTMRQEVVMELVHEVYGENAQVVTARTQRPRSANYGSHSQDAPAEKVVASARRNPFVERAKAPEDVVDAEVVDPEFYESTQDAVKPENLDAQLDQVEASMTPPADIEKRGASIAGLHSSDIS
jgi:hypothetical protein